MDKPKCQVIGCSEDADELATWLCQMHMLRLAWGETLKIKAAVAAATVTDVVLTSQKHEG